MKTEEFKRLIIEEMYLKKWILPTDDYMIPSWNWNEDGSVDVKGYLKIEGYNFSKLPIKFRKVYGPFNCESPTILTMENFPEEISGWFGCSSNNFTSLKCLPKKVGANVYFHSTVRYFSEIEIRNKCDVGGVIAY